MKTWLKGVVIGSVIGLIGSLFSYLFIPPIGDALVPTGGPFKFLLLPFVLVGVIFSLGGTFGCNFKNEACFSESMLGYIVTIISFGLIGALIGWVIGKIKNKNKI